MLHSFEKYSFRTSVHLKGETWSWPAYKTMCHRRNQAILFSKYSQQTWVHLLFQVRNVGFTRSSESLSYKNDVNDTDVSPASPPLSLEVTGLEAGWLNPKGNVWQEKAVT